MKWKFMFKFKNNILTLGASDVYIFNNLLRMKAWISMCVASCLPAFKGSCVLCGVCLSAWMWASVDVFTCAHERLCMPGANTISIFSGLP